MRVLVVVWMIKRHHCLAQVFVAKQQRVCTNLEGVRFASAAYLRTCGRGKLMTAQQQEQGQDSTTETGKHLRSHQTTCPVSITAARDRRHSMARPRRTHTVPSRVEVSPNSHAYAKRLLKWLITYVETGDQHLAEQESQAGSGAKRVILERLRARGTVAAAHSPGRPRKFNEDVCAMALKLLEKHDGQQLTLIGLLSLLVDEGYLDAGANRDAFSRRLRQHVKEQGMYMNTTSTSTVFLLAEQDKAERVKFCKDALQLLNTTSLDDIVFVDETTVEECPHPKGEDARRLSVAFAHHADLDMVKATTLLALQPRPCQCYTALWS
jgi:hypothetical protein